MHTFTLLSTRCFMITQEVHFLGKKEVGGSSTQQGVKTLQAVNSEEKVKS